MKEKKKLVPFLTAGYPTKERCRALLEAVVAAGADAVELGIPFSDPLADGPVIQAASQAALDGGTTPEDAFELAADFRRRHRIPLYFMTYANPVARYGADRFMRRCATEGIAGVILPDVPPEESAPFEGRGVPLVYLCSPTCSDARIRLIAKRSRPFVYLVSLKGVTGARIADDVAPFVRRVRRRTDRPLYVGFGISTPAQAKAAARVADGVIVGSALLRIVQGGGTARDVARFVGRLRRVV